MRLNRSRFTPAAFVVCTLGAFFVVHCGSSGAPCADTLTCATAGDGGGGDAVIPNDCDLTADSNQPGGCVVDAVGVFVDGQGGSDSNPGTKQAPVKSITQALTLTGSKPRIYICTGSYSEHVKIESDKSLLGGYRCSDWSITADKSELTSPDKDPAITVVGSKTTVISDIEIMSMDATKPGDSSIAAFFSGATVTVRRTSFRAGRGLDANPPGSTPTALGDAPPGNSGGALMHAGEPLANTACATSIGGAGGSNAKSNGDKGSVALPASYPDDSTGAAGVTGAGTCTANGAAGFGRNGSFGTGGTGGIAATAVGTIAVNGWTAGVATAGGRAADGQGGGGGAQLAAPGVGGGGGPGGCGGAAGEAGKSGGSSIAVLVFDSTLLSVASSFAAQDAGNGAKGGDGQTGQRASTETTTPSNGAQACSGGIGGHGGSGGGGGGGAGGVSVGILYKGVPPSIDGSIVGDAQSTLNIVTAKAGSAGMNGAGGVAASSTAGDAARLKGGDAQGVPAAGFGKAISAL